jgi:hypothetical protein
MGATSTSTLLLALLAAIPACGQPARGVGWGSLAPSGAPDGGVAYAPRPAAEPMGPTLIPPCVADGGETCLLPDASPPAPPKAAACAPPASADAGAPIPARCNANGWCEENAPLVGVTTVQAFGADDVWFGLQHFHGGALDAAPVEGLAEADRALSPIGLAGVSSTDLWATVANGALHFDGCRWTRDARVTKGGPIFALSSHDVWIATLGTLQHFDGQSWQSEDVPGFFVSAVHAATPGHPWIVGHYGAYGPHGAKPNGVALHRTSDGWAMISLPAVVGLTSVWSFAEDDTWATGGGQLYHWDGQSMTPQSGPGSISGLTGLGAHELWASSGAKVWHYDGSTWTVSALPALDGTYPGTIEARADDDVWAVGNGHALHYDGATWQPRFRVEGRFSDIDVVPGTSGAIAYASGGPLARRDPDGVWRAVEIAGGAPVNQVATSGANDVWATTDASTFHFDGTAWSRFDLPTPEPATVCTAGAGAAYALGKSGKISRFDPATGWSADGAINPAGVDISCFSTDEAFIGGLGNSTAEVFKRHKGAWERLAPIGIPRTIVARRRDDVWAVGETGLTRFDGIEWSGVAGAQASVLDSNVGLAVARSPAGTMWALNQRQDAAGERTFLRSYDETLDAFRDVAELVDLRGLIWGGLRGLFAFSDQSVLAWRPSEQVDLYDGASLAKLVPASMGDRSDATAWFSSPSSGWAYDQRAQRMRRLVGTAWSDDPTFPLAPLVRSIFGFAADDVWAAGHGIAHFDGTAWTTVSTIIDVDWIWGAAHGDLWLGAAGNLMHLKDGALTIMPLPPNASIGGGAAGLTADDVWIAGHPMLRWNGYSLTPYQTLEQPIGFAKIAGEMHALDVAGDDWVRSPWGWRRTSTRGIAIPPPPVNVSPFWDGVHVVLTAPQTGLLQVGTFFWSVDPTGAKAELSTYDDHVTKADTDGVVAYAVGPDGRVLRRR